MQEPDHAGRGGEPGDACRALEVNRLEALPALAGDADQVDDGFGVSHCGAHLVLAAKVGDDGLVARAGATARTFRPPGGDADGPAVLRQAWRY